MKNALLFSVFFFSLIFTSPVLKATHYMGGEITWECLSNGRYRFILKAYRECYVDSATAAVNYANTQYLYSNSPAGSIQLQEISGWPKDISPECNSDTNFSHITCVGMPNAGANMGAVQEHIFTSDANYPNGVLLQGTPPAAGWTFYWGSCCRNPATNVVSANAKSWRLRAIMYPYGNQNTFPCFDNSPTFAEKPVTVVPAGEISYNNLAYDVDFDSLQYEWGQPLLSNGNPLSPYATGYTYTNPLPGVSQNASNVDAHMDSATGMVSLTSYTTGAFVTSIKVTSYRNGTKISEIWRDIQVVISQGSSQNTHPDITPPFSSGTSYDYTVYAGDTVMFYLISTDMQFLPNGSPQTIEMNYFGRQFGDFVTPVNGGPPMLSSTQGCPKPPCATLIPAPGPGYPLQGVLGVQTQFKWVTNCDHLDGHSSKTYRFLITAKDDFCPVPAIKAQIIKITVKDKELPLPTVDLMSISFDYDSLDVLLTWSKAVDSLNQFEGYFIYQSNTANGPFTLVDSIMNINDTNARIHTGAINTAYFYLKVKSHTSCLYGILSSPSQSMSLLLTNIEDIVKKEGFYLMQNRPNPASQYTDIEFIMDKSGEVEFQLTNTSGLIVESRKIESKVGLNKLRIDLNKLAAGIYYYSVDFKGMKKTRKMVVMSKQ